MKRFKLIAVDKISSIEVYVKVKNGNYYYREYKRRRFLKGRKEGFYIWGIGGEIYVEDSIIMLDDRLYIEDKTVYFKPHVDITLTNGNAFTKFFETIEEMNDFIDQEYLSKIKLIEM